MARPCPGSSRRRCLRGASRGGGQDEFRSCAAGAAGWVGLAGPAPGDHVGGAEQCTVYIRKLELATGEEAGARSRRVACACRVLVPVRRRTGEGGSSHLPMHNHPQPLQRTKGRGLHGNFPLPWSLGRPTAHHTGPPLPVSSTRTPGPCRWMRAFGCLAGGLTFLKGARHVPVSSVCTSAGHNFRPREGPCGPKLRKRSSAQTRAVRVHLPPGPIPEG